jgi:hypothetical protein
MNSPSCPLFALFQNVFRKTAFASASIDRDNCLGNPHFADHINPRQPPLQSEQAAETVPARCHLEQT